MDFLCDAMDLKQSVGGTLKVLGKSLTTVLDEVHIIFNLSSFPLPLVPQSKPFLPQGKSFAPLPGRATSKTPLSFSVSPSFLRISQFPGCNQRNGKQCWLSPLSFKISLKDTSFHISINSLGLYLSPECLFNFLSKFYIPPCAGKISNFHSKLVPKFLSSRPRQKEITHSTRQRSFENLFLPTAERGGGNNLLCQNSVRKNEDDLVH